MNNAARLIIVALFALAIADSITIASDDPAPRRGNTKQQNQGDSTKAQPQSNRAPILAETPQTNHHENQRDGDAANKGWITLAAAIASAVAAIGSFLAGSTLLRHHWSIARPWVVMTVIENNVKDALQSGRRPPFGRFVVKCAVTNYGSVPGWLLREHSSLRVIRHPVWFAKPRFRWTARRLMKRCPLHPLRPGVSEFHGFDTACDLTARDWTALRAGRASVIFFAFFKYRGVRKRRWTREPVAWFAWEWLVAKTPEGYSGTTVATGPAWPRRWTRYT
jgi:hypothetical protein